MSRSLCQVRAIVGPNRYHHLYSRSALDSLPKAELFLAPGLAEKRPRLPRSKRLGEDPKLLGRHILALPVAGAPSLSEIVFVHSPSQTLVVTDLLLNVTKPASLMTGLYMSITGTNGKLAQNRIWRFLVKDSAAHRASPELILERPIERIVMAHGEVFSSDSPGSAARASVLRWSLQSMTGPAQTAIVVFARGAEAEDKRLAASTQEAARLSELLLKRTLQTVGRAPRDVDVIIAIDGHLPPDWLRPISESRSVHVIPQRGIGFEARILGALDDGRGLGYRRLLIVGIDTPSMSPSDLRRACEAPHPVLGPSTDGGFYLLGLNEDQLERLRDLPWCTEHLLTALTERFDDLRLESLVPRADLDRPADLRKQRARLARLALRLLGRSLEDRPSGEVPLGLIASPRSWRVQTGLALRGPPTRVEYA